MVHAGMAVPAALRLSLDLLFPSLVPVSELGEILAASIPSLNKAIVAVEYLHLLAPRHVLGSSIIACNEYLSG